MPKFTPLFRYACSILCTLTTLNGAAIFHMSGVRIYTDDIKANSTITVNGGEIYFTGTVKSKTDVLIDGGVVVFSDDILNQVNFDISSGDVRVETIRNNGTINLRGDALLTIGKSVGNATELFISDVATLTLNNNDIFGNNSRLRATGGTILTQGNSLNFMDVLLDGSTVIDLGGVVSSIDLGNVSGNGQLIFTNWSPETVISYASGSSFLPDSQFIFEGAHTLSSAIEATPIPEANIATVVGLMSVFWLCTLRRRPSD